MIRWAFCFMVFIPTLLWSQLLKLVLPLGHSGGINCAAFSTDQKKIITGSEDNTVKIWDAQSGILLADINDSGKVQSITFSPDGKKFVTTNSMGSIRIYDANTGAMQTELIRRKYISIAGAFFSNDGNKIIAVYGVSVVIWDIAKKDIITSFETSHTLGISNVALSKKGNMILTSSYDSTAKLWNIESGKLLLDIKDHTSYVLSASFSPDEKKIVTATLGGTVKIWNALSGELLVNFKKHKNPFLGGALFYPDNEKIISVAKNGEAFIWDALSGDCILEIKNCPAEVRNLSFSPDGKKIIIAGEKIAKIFDAKTGGIINILEGHAGNVNRIIFGNSSNFFLTTEEGPSIRKNIIKLWDIHAAALVSKMNGYSSDVNSVSFSPDETRVASASNDSIAKIWDANSGGVLFNIKSYDPFVRSTNFSRDGQKLAVTFSSVAQIWDIKTKTLFTELKGHKSYVTSAEFSPDGKTIATSSWDSTVKIWNSNTGDLLYTLNGHISWTGKAIYSDDSKKIISQKEIFDKTPKLWDLGNGSLINNLTQDQWINAAFFTHNNYVFTLSDKFRSWDVNTGKQVLAFNDFFTNNLFGLLNACLSKNGNKLTTYGSSEVCTWDYRKGELITRFKPFQNQAQPFFGPDLKNLITVPDNLKNKIWDMDSGKEVCIFLPIGLSDYLFQIPTGYYKATTAASKLLHYVTRDLKVITFEQLDIKYNRPDKVLEAIGTADTALIKSYRKAWEKRIKKLAVDTTSFRDGYSVPEADFTNRDKIEYEQKSGLLRLNIKGLDSIYKLDRFNIWVNEAPCFGQRGISILKRNKNGFDTTVTITLSQGENRIETSIINVNGTESYRIPLVLNYSPDVKQKEILHFVGIGIDEFKDKNRNLKFSRKDIRDLARKLREKYGENIVIDTLLNKNVTITNIKALKQKLLKTTVNDKIILAYSGHGLLNKDFDYYLSTYSVNFENPEQNGLPYDELENLLDSIPARKKLLLIDACHSGELDKDEVEKIHSMSDSLKHNGVKANESKGIDPVKNKSHLGMQNSFELMQNLFVNVSRNTGATIIAAAGGTQFALEKGDLQNGVFTYSILEAMNKYPYIKVSELKKIVGERVEQLTNGLQKPVSRNETISVDWNVW